MKKHVKTIVKGMTLSLFLMAFVGLFNGANAQDYYGGSAYVHVKDNKGNTRVLNTTASCSYATEAEAKNQLKTSLGYAMKGSEEYTSQIYFSIDGCYSSDKKYYGGTASVKVRDEDGKTRMINTTASCSYETKAEAKNQLKTSLGYEMKGSEEYISAISYDIDSCN